jgi:hypothetical protein
MSTIRITNNTQETLFLRELYVSIAPGDTKDCVRSPSELASMSGLQTYITGGLVTVQVTMSQEELTSALVVTWPEGLNWKSSVATAASLPVSGNERGDMRVALDSLDAHVWNGSAWADAGGLGLPAPHAATHRTGSTDALGTSTVTPTISTFRLAIHEANHRVGANGKALGTINQNGAAAVMTSQPGHMRTIDVLFPVNWLGGTITLTGHDAKDVAVSQTYTSPGAGGGLVAGTKIFCMVMSGSNSAPAGVPANPATIQTGTKLGTANKPVAVFTKLAVEGVFESFVDFDLVEGAFTPTTPSNGNRDYEVCYSIDITPTQLAHNHNIT